VTTVNVLVFTTELYCEALLALILCQGTRAVLNTSNRTGRVENKELRLSLDPEVELLCMVSPLK